MKTERVFLVVLDSVGIGAAPDAAAFGDAGADTMKSISREPGFRVPHLLSLGLGNIDGLSYLGKTDAPQAATMRLQEISAGKDTTVGHFEIAGVISERPFPTYKDGFPERILAPFRKQTGRGVLCNKPYSGTEVIRDYGEEHMRTGDLIVYTSADSVFQIAAHEDVVPLAMLYEYCRIARTLLQGEDGVSRVIARPFRGEPGRFYRTEGRRDFAFPAPRDTLLDILSAAGRDVIAVGKIHDIFAGRGMTESIPSHNNREGMEAMLALEERDFCGLAFINLVDFDMLYGHRNDCAGYAAALSAFDAFLPAFLSKMRATDVLLITADHGCDPGDISTDHTREYTPLLVYGDAIRPVNLGTRRGFSDIAKTIAAMLDVPAPTLAGTSFLSEVKK